MTRVILLLVASWWWMWMVGDCIEILAVGAAAASSSSVSWQQWLSSGGVTRPTTARTIRKRRRSSNNAEESCLVRRKAVAFSSYDSTSSFVMRRAGDRCLPRWRPPLPNASLSARSSLLILQHAPQPESSSSSSFQGQQQRPRITRMDRVSDWRRPAAIILLCALFTLGPRFFCNLRAAALAMRQYPTSALTMTTITAAAAAGTATTRSWSSLSLLWHFRPADMATFVLLCASSLTLADPMRREIAQIADRFRSAFRQIAKHAPKRTRRRPPPWKKTKATQAGGDHQDHQHDDPAMRVTAIGIVLNLVLSLGKWFVGVTCHSSALVADAGHSLSDLASDFVTVLAVQVSRLPPDDDHPYGHGKFEAIGSMFLAMALLATGFSVAAMSQKNLLAVIRSGSGGSVVSPIVANPKPMALIMAAISIISKEWLFRITHVVGKRLNSPVLMANAWHHRSDAYSSVVALISIGLAMFVPGLLVADSMAGLVVAGMICLTGADILGESIKQLSDHNDQELAARVTDIIRRSPAFGSSSLSQSSEDDIDSNKSSGNDSNFDHSHHHHNSIATVDQVRARQVGSQSVIDVRLTTTMEQAQRSAVATRSLEELIRQQILTDDTVSHAILDAQVRAVPPSPILLRATSTTTTPKTTSTPTTTTSSSPFFSNSGTLPSSFSLSSVTTTTIATGTSAKVAGRNAGIAHATAANLENEIRGQALSITGIGSVELVNIHPIDDSFPVILPAEKTTSSSSSSTEQTSTSTRRDTSCRISVDVAIRLDDESSYNYTVSQAAERANFLRSKVLESWGDDTTVDRINVFLDLNHHPQEHDNNNHHHHNNNNHQK